jgi:Holliday junction resolvase RusA-like endonuclease
MNSEGLKKYNIDPVAKPRMTQSDKWKKRPATSKYWAFCDQCLEQQVFIPLSGSMVYFIIPMPESWSKKKKEQMNDRPHQQKPDIDNLLKAVLDAIYLDDQKVWDVHVKKRWGYEGAIYVSTLE